MAQRDGVADGWILYEAWCKRNGGTPIRGRSGDHICFVGPLPDSTIDPGDDGTVDMTGTGPGGVFDILDERKLEIAMKHADLQLEEARLRHERTKTYVETARKARERK